MFAPEVSATKAVSPPVRRQGGGYSWSLETIRSARDAQLRGQFDLPVRMAEAFRTNDALFTAYNARVSTQSAVKLLWSAADTEPGKVVAKRAELSIHTPQHARESILGTLANHGIAIGYVQHAVHDDPEHGPTVAMTLTEWPLEHVRYNPSSCTLETRTTELGTITITHGDGRWIIFRKFGFAPWTQDACVLPGALLWAAHGAGISDWAAASFSHGQSKVVATLKEGVTIGDGATLTAEAEAVLNVVSALVNGESGAGVLPHGTETKLLFNGSTAWQVFDALVLNREKAAQRIYLGTDAALGSQGGAPGIDIAALFNVASTRIQGDLECLERGFREGMILPWSVLHGVALADVSKLTYAMPDVDGERRSAQEAAAMTRLGEMIGTMKAAGLIVSQDTVGALTKILGVTVHCELASPDKKAVPLQLAPTDIARVVRVKEAREAQGLTTPLGEGRDDMTIAELEEYTKAKAAAEAAANATPPADAPSDGGGDQAPKAPESEPEPQSKKATGADPTP